MSLALSGDTIAYLMELGLSSDQMRGLVDRLQRDALAMTPPTETNGVNEERERLRNQSTYAERKRAKDRDRRAREREELRRLRGESPATTPAIHGEATATEGDNPATTGDPALTYAQVVTPPSSLRSEDKPPTLPSGASPKGVARSKSTVRRSRFVPDDWSPTESDAAYAAGLGFTPGEIERELAKFRKFEFARPYSHWSQTYQNWLERAAERRTRKAHEQPSPSDAKLAAKQANYERAWTGSERALGRDRQP